MVIPPKSVRRAKVRIVRASTPPLFAPEVEPDELVTQRPDGTRIFGYCPDCDPARELVHAVESDDDGRIVQSLWCIKCEWRRWL